jgi:hypothetical protein
MKLLLISLLALTLSATLKPRHILMKCYDNSQSRDNGIANATATLIQFGYYPDGYLRITNSPGMYCFEMGVVDAQ